MGQKTITKNSLFYGDNLEIMRQYMADESVDLIYLDPPFNSSRNYNVLYKDESGAESDAQIVAFEDTWHWTRQITEPEFIALKKQGDNLAELLTTLVKVLGRNPMTAYLVMMSSRLVELHRVLKPTGCLYLHCDSTASHYLRMVLDMIFGVGNFVNEISWERSSTRSSISKSFRKAHDIILFYTKSENYTYHLQYKELSKASLKLYDNVDERGNYQLVPLLVSGKRNGETGQVWQGIDPNTRGKAGMHWVTVPAKLDEYERQGLVVWPDKKDGIPRLKYYLEQSPGVPLNDLWYDIQLISSSGVEALGYPTQKPLALLERIIQASSNPGDVVLDPFCGCGTAVHAAQKLGRTWIGIDITRLATTLIKSRLYDAFGIEAKKDYNLIGEPTTLSEARHLAKQDRYQFQWWALGLIPARPQGGLAGSKEGKKGSDKGIDGVMTFQDTASGLHKRIIIQVKSGKVKPGDIRDLNGTVDREKATMGVFITLEPPSQNMEMEALELETWHSEAFNRDYPKIQILTIEQLLAGAKVQFPGTDTTLKQAQREQAKPGEQGALL